VHRKIGKQICRKIGKSDGWLDGDTNRWTQLMGSEPDDLQWTQAFLLSWVRTTGVFTVCDVALK
jgi:hypothetical protein